MLNWIADWYRSSISEGRSETDCVLGSPAPKRDALSHVTPVQHTVCRNPTHSKNLYLTESSTWTDVFRILRATID